MGRAECWLRVGLVGVAGCSTGVLEGFGCVVLDLRQFNITPFIDSTKLPCGGSGENVVGIGDSDFRVGNYWGMGIIMVLH